VPTTDSRTAVKQFSVSHEMVLKHRRRTVPAIKQRGSAMLTLILNVIYRQFLKAALTGTTSGWARR
jgi:hypothetical protein